MVELLLRILVAIRETVGGIREVGPAARVKEDVIRTVQAFALEAIRQDASAVIRFDAGDLPVAVLAEDQPPF